MKKTNYKKNKWFVQVAFSFALFTCLLQGVSAQVTIKTHQTTLGKVIKQIQAQQHYQFFYDDTLAKLPIVDLDVKNESLEKVLNKILKGKNITYTIEDKVVYLKKQVSKLPKKQPTNKKNKITGKVNDENNQPMIGVTVTVKGTTQRSVTDIEGNYTIVTSEHHPVLVFDYLGYKSKEVKVGSRGVVSTSMEVDAKSIDEIVVTALGIKREKKMLGYAVQDIKSDALNTTGDPSITSALDGKVAGLQMNTSSTGIGGSTKITIRGNSSLTDNNQPLWIVDGVPFTDEQNSEASAYGGYDRGGTALDINPEDIESISVLKGPNAAALYGARAGNGVILVTTKKGVHKDGLGITYSGSYTWSEVSQTIDMQKQYGQGLQGHPIYITNDKGEKALSGELSFGSLLDGHKEPSWLYQSIPYRYDGDKLRDYFKTGFSQFHTIAVGNATEKSHYRLSAGFNGNDGLFKNETLNKLNIDLNTGTVINKYLSLDGKISLSRLKAENRPMTGLNGEVAQLLLIPGNVRLTDLQQYTTNTHLHQSWFGPNQQYSNPYYVRHQYQNEDERWRAFGYYAANMCFTNWLKLNAKYAFDYYRTRIQTSNLSLADQAISTKKQHWSEMLTTDNMQKGEVNHFEHNISLLLLGDTYLSKVFRLGYTLGSNVMYQQHEILNVGVENMLDKDNWLFNSAERLTTANNNGFSKAMYSVFGSLQLAYNEYLALDLTARNDWSSTLPSSHRSFFYPSASISYVFSDFMKSIKKPLPLWITFAKIRFSAAQVGKDPMPYHLYNVRKFAFQNGKRIPVAQTIKMNSNLKPEIKKSIEAGVDMKFFSNRLGFDFTYYYSTTKNQAMLVDASSP